jgi:hypothetical protein
MRAAAPTAQRIVVHLAVETESDWQSVNPGAQPAVELVWPGEKTMPSSWRGLPNRQI